MRGGWFAGGKGKNTGNGTPAVNLLANLAKCRSWDGYSLADIGPFPDGTMPDYFYGLCEVLGEYDYTPKDKMVTVTNAGKKPSKVTILATGEKLDYQTDGKAITFTIPAEKTTSLLDVIKMQW